MTAWRFEDVTNSILVNATVAGGAHLWKGENTQLHE